MSTTAVAFLLREADKKGVVIRADWPRYIPRMVVKETGSEDWEETAGSMAKAFKDMFWVFRWGVAGKLTGHDFLCCDVCDEVMMRDKGEGTPSKKSKCHSNPKCEGIYRRLPEVFEVEPHPRAPQKGVVWTFSDDGLVIVATQVTAEQAKAMGVVKNTFTLQPIPMDLYNWVNGDSELVISFVSKTVPQRGTTIITSKDGVLSWEPMRWATQEELAA